MIDAAEFADRLRHKAEDWRALAMEHDDPQAGIVAAALSATAEAANPDDDEQEGEAA